MLFTWDTLIARTRKGGWIFGQSDDHNYDETYIAGCPRENR